MILLGEPTMVLQEVLLQPLEHAVSVLRDFIAGRALASEVEAALGKIKFNGTADAQTQARADELQQRVDTLQTRILGADLANAELQSRNRTLQEANAALVHKLELVTRVLQGDAAVPPEATALYPVRLARELRAERDASRNGRFRQAIDKLCNAAGLSGPHEGMEAFDREIDERVRIIGDVKARITRLTARLTELLDRVQGLAEHAKNLESDL